MKSLDGNQPISTGQQKIDEYVRRIKNGEPRDSIFQGLPESFRSAIKKKLAEPVEEVGEKIEQGVNGVPPQYEGLPADILEDIWTIPEYIDPEKTKRLKEAKAKALVLLREKESGEK